MGTVLADQGVAGSFVDRVVKGDVGLDHRLHVLAADGAPPGVEQRRVEHRPAPGGQARCQCVDRAPHFVDLGDVGGVERGDEHAAPGAS